ncbi:phospholipid-transporting ATPase ABCA7-like isoform X2 [Bacillus rossius redtenbacheri]|uniref:phospholipid-transporting ATPase ABCA7-like isoform X2 n=1 Tax=Bacillus rossius redtenbacheri TaxID=93214 RepID=UPI002FDD184A
MTFLQLRMLLWKNYVLRKRQKVRCVAEIIWPLFLFLILMWVRTRELKDYVHECHFDRKALPSAGQIPFLLSFFCTFNNTCYASDRSYNNSPDSYNNSIFYRLMSDVELVLQNETTLQKIRSASRAMKDFEDLSYLIRNITSGSRTFKGHVSMMNLLREKSELMDIIGGNVSESDLNSLLNTQVNLEHLSLTNLLALWQNPQEMLCDGDFLSKLIESNEPDAVGLVQDVWCKTDNFSIFSILKPDYEAVLEELVNAVEGNLGRGLSYEQWHQLTSLMQQVASDVAALDAYKSLLERVTYLGKEYQTMNSKLQTYNMSSLYSIFTLLQKIICSRDWETRELRSKEYDQSNRFDAFRDQLREMNNDVEDYIYDNDTTPFCNSVFKNLENNTMTRFLWLQIKPLFRGKILFAPDTVATRRVMQRVNETFDSILTFRLMLEETLNETVRPLRNLVKDVDTVRFVKSFVDSPMGIRLLQLSVNNSIVNTFFKENVDWREEYVKNFTESFLDNDNVTVRKKTLDSIDNAHETALKVLECFESNKIAGFDTEQEAAELGMELLLVKKLWAVVSFVDFPANSSDASLPPFITYKIRMDSSSVDETKQIEDRLPRPGPRRRPSIDLKYITNGFAYLQDLIEKSIIMDHSGRNSTPGMYLQQFPYPCYIVDTFMLAISRTFPLFMVLSWVYSCSMIIKSVVYEKERRLKETMRVMGLSNSVHWVGWFVDSILPALVSVALLTLILVGGRVLENSDPSVVYVFLLLFCVATIAKSFLISVFFSRANLAAAAGGIIFFMLYLPYPFMIIWEEKISSLPKLITSILSNVAFGFGCSYFAHYEEMGVGVHWHNFGESPLLGDKYNLKYVMYMFVIDTLVYLMLTWYIEAVFPGQYGVPKPWYFPLQCSYWRGNDATVGPNSMYFTENEKGENFETEPSHLPLGVSVHQMGKVYANRKVAVRNLNINFYEDQITSFLGHNGAGKTTTISILTGLIRPSSGTAKVYGQDIRHDMDSIRKSLGMCPQHNVLFDLLTVEEHLWFYARLKGRRAQEVRREIEDMLWDLQLPDKRDTLAQHLSGGMQRKLSVAVSFIGGSRTVILDEPTAGVDPYSRRSIWELLLKYKKGRTIILTTHYMDEADLLGDRIAIIANGRLRCCGSSLFLKSRFGTGYYLTLELDLRKLDLKPCEEKAVPNGCIPGTTIESQHHDLDILHITEAVCKHVPSATLHQQRGSELVYLLPHGDGVQPLQLLLDYLDTDMAALGVSSYGLTDTMLEEIFLKVAEEAEPVANGVVSGRGSAVGNITKRMRILNPRYLLGQKRNSSGSQTHVTIVGAPPDVGVPTTDTINPRERPRGLYWRQFWALFIKRFHHTYRNPKALLSELVVPALFVCLSLGFTSVLPQLSVQPALSLEPWLYGPPNHVFFSSERPRDNWTRAYERELLGTVGMGTRCAYQHGERSTHCKPLEVDSIVYKTNVSVPTEPVECSCARGTMQCPAGAAGPAPPSAVISTGDIMFNVTGRNISDWLVKTTSEYYKMRYGGFTFGVTNLAQYFNTTRIQSLLGKVLPNIIGNISIPWDFEDFASRAVPEATQDEQDNIQVWFNNKGWASSVAYLNAINNVVLRASLPRGAKTNQYGMHVYNHPMNYTKQEMETELVQQSGISLLHSIAVIFALSFVPASFVVFLVEERVSNAKHLQFVSGVNRMVYWVSTYCWDMMAYMVAALLCVFVFLAFNEQAYVSESNFPGLVLLLVIYGWAIIPLMYPASFIFSEPSTAFVGLACTNVFIGVITTVATFVLEIFDDDELQYIASIIRQVFLVFPHFCLGQGLMNIAGNHFASQALAVYGITVKTNVLKWGILGKNLVSMFVAGIVFFLINLAIEYQLYKYCSFKRKVDPDFPDDEDSDVATERDAVLRGETNDSVLVLKNLTKVYGTGRAAVNHLCVRVRKGECFGLLGLNGAGKTSTFKMLTGDVSATGGDALVCGRSARREMDAVRQHLGYCPQFDALDPLLTVREHLELYCRLQGVPSAQIQEVVDNGLKILQLGAYERALAGDLSGGNKRKLSTAISLIGDPPLVFLDEPTSGMDPKARRFLWSCVQDVVASGRSVVLTSHSMEECEALCTRVTVMVNGTFRCLGSTQHLKSKYGGGYMLTVRCSEEKRAATLGLVAERLPRAQMKEQHYNQLRYELPQESLRLSQVFRDMERARRDGLLLDYSLSQTTLEEVFMRFAKEQIIDENAKKRGWCGHCVACCSSCFGGCFRPRAEE